LDAVFTVAGVAPYAPSHAIPEADWDAVLAINVKGLAYCCAAVFPHLKDNGGVIVNMASDAGIIDDPLHSAAYSASKGAVISYTRTIAKEWAKYGIRVNCVNPVVHTSLSDEVLAKMSPEDAAQYQREIHNSVPLGGKLGDIKGDLAPALAFLASDAAKFITSQMIPVNGGFAYTR
jgi:NAD(P)-dependent dehydrogenase (short-subunit alcohol dehydrogenase family)